MTEPPEAALKQFEDELVARAQVCYELTLFVSGASDLSGRAIANARNICELHLAGRYHLLVVDLSDDLAATRSSQVVAAPTLVRIQPLPVKMLIGDLSHTDKVLLALDLPAATPVPER